MTPEEIDRAFTIPDGWLEYSEWRGGPGTVTGRVLVRPGVRSEPLGTQRHILVYLPPSLSRAEPGRRYPVIYMHDGQNLFDAATSDFGEWRIDETMEALAGEGIEGIVVGIPNGEAADPPLAGARPLEYSPHADAGRGGGRADDYLDHIAMVVKPLVDAAFPTLREVSATGLAGSSLGGLVSLYALAARPDAFGFAGVISPALWFAGGRVLAEQAPLLRPGVRVYLDVGGREGEHEATPEERAAMSRRYVDDARALHRLLLDAGFRDGDDLLYAEDPGAPHHQSAWAARMPGMLRFLLRPWRAA